jgi:predicted adenine nucleotide alpha hydrolase (AANH) superfamily ATPase
MVITVSFSATCFAGADEARCGKCIELFIVSSMAIAQKAGCVATGMAMSISKASSG